MRGSKLYPGACLLDFLKERVASREYVMSRLRLTAEEFERFLRGELRVTQSLADSLWLLTQIPSDLWLSLDRVRVEKFHE